MAEAKFKVPKALGACADLMYQLKQDRLELQRQVEVLAERESILRNHLIENLPKSQAEGITGKLARATITKDIQPRVENWDLVYKYIKKTGSFELLQRRLSTAAVQERWDLGKELPGIGTFTVVKVSLNKV